MSEETPKPDFSIISRDLKIPAEQIEQVVTLLDEGNTIPFITRFRKDLVGGLNEHQIQGIKARVEKSRAIAERKAFITKSIESHGKLTDALKAQIEKTESTRRLEDIYLPFKPKKQSLASAAKQQGLEPLANDIFEGVSPDIDLATRATDFVRVDKGLNSVDEVIAGVGHILAERFSERSDVRSSLRKIMWETGALVANQVEVQEPAKQEEAAPTKTEGKSEDAKASGDASEAKTESLVAKPSTADVTETVSANMPKAAEDVAAAVVTAVAAETPSETSNANGNSEAGESKVVGAEETPTEAKTESETPTEESTSDKTPAEAGPQEAVSEETKTEPAAASEKSGDVNPQAKPSADAEAPPKKKKKKKKKKKVNDPFKEYHGFKESLAKIRHHHVLGINRGVRGGKLQTKLECDQAKLKAVVHAALPEEHPFRPFLEKSAEDSLERLIYPALEREVRREITENAERHAVSVFANNLRNLLLKPPVSDCRVIAIDPGFKRGCTMVALDEHGNLLATDRIFVVGNAQRREQSQKKIGEWVKTYDARVIAIGNGTACRETELMVSAAINDSDLGVEVRYTIVNEAGATVYSTSEIGREELPDATADTRSAVSIGRRLQDPLAELVKISPANIGVGMYQHDVKAKHLVESLDEVVQFCVNQVGVNVNTASPSLLKYVSGLNQLTARRLCEHRKEKGRFSNREQLKEVTGVGDSTYVQAAGFLRVRGGDQPLDATGIHPESYPLAEKVIAKVGVGTRELFPLELIDEAIVLQNETPPPVPVAVTPPPQKAAVTEAAAEKTETPVAESQTAEPVAAEAVVAESTPAATADVEAGETVVKTPASPESVAPESVASESVASESVASEASVGSDAEAAAEPTSAPAADPPAEAQPVAEAKAAEAVAPAEPAPVKRVRRPKPAPNPQRESALKKLAEVRVNDLSAELGAGNMLMLDVVRALKRPDWDPREKVPKPVFRKGVIKVDDLKAEMQLDAQVVNVVDFGVFVDIGLGESCLVHVSQLSHHFIRDPQRMFAVGDVMRVWVSEIDQERRRVKLTAIKPGSKKPERHHRKSTSQGGGRGNARTQEKGPRKARGKATTGARGGAKSHQRKDRPKRKREYTTARKATPAKPLTKGMLTGKEPMRSFADLAQFVKKKPEDVEKKTESDSGNSGKSNENKE